MTRHAACLALAAALAALAPAGARQPQPKAKAQPKKAKTDADLILGTWQIAKLEAGGKEEPEKNYRYNTFVFSRDKGGDRATLWEQGHPPVEFTFKLNPAANPKEIDLTTKNGVTIRGVYKLDADDLTLCLSVGPARPADFTTKAGGDTETFTLRRSKWERYTDKGLGFSVDLPGKPQERKRKAGETVTTVLTTRGEIDRLTYVVTVTPVPARPDDDQLEAAVEAARAAIAEELEKDGKVTGTERGTFRGPVYSGTELTLALELTGAKDRAAARVRLFVVGDRLFGLTVAGAEEATKSNNVGRFWNSFTTPKKGKGKN
jgi:uncharacterized protein (TIGR03067 family)